LTSGKLDDVSKFKKNGASVIPVDKDIHTNFGFPAPFVFEPRAYTATEDTNG